MTKRANGITSRATKRLLRRRSSQHYFNGYGWTANPEEAKTFSDVIEVAETCTRHGLIDVEVALRVEQCDVFCTPLR
jgi:hypothetical protein